MKLIKLHTRGDGTELYINPEYIVSFWKFNKGSCVKTNIDINANNSFDVMETPEQIIKEIHAAHSINPLTFTIERIQEGVYTLEEVE